MLEPFRTGQIPLQQCLSLSLICLQIGRVSISKVTARRGADWGNILIGSHPGRKGRIGYKESQIRWQLEQLRPKDQKKRKIFKLSGFPLVFPPPTHPSYFALESLFWGHHSDKDRIENREWTAWSFILWLIFYRQVKQTKKKTSGRKFKRGKIFNLYYIIICCTLVY